MSSCARQPAGIRTEFDGELAVAGLSHAAGQPERQIRDAGLELARNARGDGERPARTVSGADDSKIKCLR